MSRSLSCEQLRVALDDTVSIQQRLTHIAVGEVGSVDDFPFVGQITAQQD